MSSKVELDAKIIRYDAYLSEEDSLISAVNKNNSNTAGLLLR